MTLGRVQMSVLIIAGAALAIYYLLDFAQIARATLIVVRDLKEQSRETAAAVSKLMRESEGETNG